MAIKLFVENILPDGTVGYTYNVAMLLENANRLKVQIQGDLKNSHGIVFQAGRFVGLLAIDSSNKVGMLFMDFKKNRKNAMITAMELLSQREHQDLLMKHFDEISAKYNQVYNDVELVVSKKFPSPPSAN